MKEGVYFLLVILGILFIVWKVHLQKQKEGFQADASAEGGDVAPEGSSPGLSIPLVSPRYQTLVEGEVKDFAPPSTALLAPPPGQMASINSLPAEDPALQKAPAGRIESVNISLRGFLEREAPGLDKLGDPTVQLPLSTAKSDKTRLESELEVMKRNPGLPSSLTQEDLNGIEANLGYLQNKWRQSVNAMSGSPMPPASSAAGQETKEGFATIGAPVQKMGWFSWLFGNASTYEGFQGETVPVESTSSTQSDVKLQDLKNLETKIGIEILKLESSGTTDLNTRARIETLTSIKKIISDLINDIETNKRTENEIPFMKSNITGFLPLLENENTALPNLFGDSPTLSLLNSLFPKYNTGDTEQTDTAQKLFKQYTEDMFNNLSWDVGLHYKGKAEQDIAKYQADAMRDAKLAAEWSPTGKGSSMTSTPEELTDKESAYRGFFQSMIDSLASEEHSDMKTTVAINGKTATKDSVAGRPPGGLDWKKRANDICDQVRARGYNPGDFGCVQNPEKMRADFPWRGYARMVCNRLGTIYDPGVPELCGCPPPTWPGWKP